MGGFSVYYSAGLAGLSAFGATAAIPHNGALWLVARLLLDTAGGFFGLYLLGALGLSAVGRAMRLRRRIMMTGTPESK
jgi:hypothetical protein